MAQNNRNRSERKSSEFSVSRVFQFDDGNVCFNLQVGRVTIYNCRVANGDNGEFIAFPSRKVEPKKRGETPKYFSHAYIRLTDQETIDIVNMVYDALDEQKNG